MYLNSVLHARQPGWLGTTGCKVLYEEVRRVEGSRGYGISMFYVDDLLYSRVSKLWLSATVHTLLKNTL